MSSADGSLTRRSASPVAVVAGVEPGVEADETASHVVDLRIGLVLGVCSALYALFIWRPSFDFRGHHYFTLFDDAMISMTYARNLSDGHGLVWNPGGAVVEGYTNPLWTLVMAGAHRVGLDEATIPLLISVVSVGFVLGCVVLAAGIARRLEPSSKYAPVLAAVFVGLYYPLVYWALRGMEVGLVTFLILAAVLLAIRLRDRISTRDIVTLCVVVAAGLLTRDDFVVPAVVVGTWLLLALKGRSRWLVTAPLVATGIAVLGGQTAFRLAYYGDPLPNTYYLKVSGQPLGPRWWRGFMTLLALVLADAVYVLGIVIAGLLSKRSEVTRRRGGTGRSRLMAAISSPVGLLLSIAVALAAYSVYVGGDAWEWARLANRYLTPAAVLLVILAAAVIEPLALRMRSARRPIFVCVFILAFGLAFGLVDSLIGVSLRDLLADYLGNTLTTVSDANVMLVVLLVVLLIAGLIGGTRRLPKWLAKGPVLVILLTGAVLFATVGNAWLTWTQKNGFYTARNAGALALGLELRDVTDPGASIAVIWAGSPIYYSHRNGVDLLGKMDPVIARGPHHEGVEVYPGHDKFDFDYSIGVLRPDVIAQYAWFTESDIDKFLAWGYVPMKPKAGVADDLRLLDVPRAQLWVRSDATKVHRELLEPVAIDVAKNTTIERR